MLNKKDPLIDAIQQVMQNNQADRDTVKAVNEKFGIQDRKVLPHERQGEWDAAYKTVLTEGVEALDEKIKMSKNQFANLDGKPGFTGADLHHARKKTHVMKAAAGTLEEDDTTSPSEMGIKKPDYATGTPDYAKSKEQTVNRAAKTSLPPGTMKEEEQIDEAGMIPKKGTIKRFLTGLNAKREARKAEKKAWPKDSGISPPSGFRKSVDRMQSMDKVAKRLGEETVSENKLNIGMPKQDASGSARKDRSDMPGTGPGQGSGAPQSRTADGKGSLPPGVSTSPKPQTVAGGKTDLPSGTTSANNNAPPAVGGARPSVVAKNSYSGAQKSTGAQVGGARPSVVAKNLPSQKTYQSGAGAMTNPTQRPYDAKTSPTAKAPVPTSKPTGGSAGSKVKPGVTKLKPVRKQPNAGAVQRPGVTAKPVKKLTPLQQQMKRSRTNRDSGIAGE